MSKKQFTLDSWLKDKSQKVVTRCGFPVRIVCTDVKRKDYPILALVERDDQEEYQSFTKDGRFSLYNPLHDNFDLFIETADEVSEDEKIRKWIVDDITFNMNNEPLNNSEYRKKAEKAIAWLEKQKEYESTDFEYVWDRTDCGELTAALDKYSEEAIINMCHAWYDKGIELERKSWLEKQGADSTILSNSSNIGKDEQKHFDYENANIQQKDFAPKVEPKFKVGEKELTDEELREGLIRGMINKHNRVVKEVLRNEYEKGRADAIAEMQKEWSDVDKDILFRIINDLKFLRDTISIDPKYAVNIIDMEREITWLKSLRPQSRWKPTDEQMGCLSDAIEHYNSFGHPAPKLKELYEQLKKL